MATAFWLKPSESGVWRLYIASPIVDRKGSGPAYRLLHPVYYGSPEPFELDTFGITMIGSRDPMTQDVLELLRQYSGRNPGRYPVPRLGGVVIDEVHIYWDLDRTSPSQNTKALVDGERNM